MTMSDGDKLLRDHIPEVADFPKPGVVFRDITPLLGDPECFRLALQRLVDWARPKQPEAIAAVDARGFILGGALAAALGCGFVPLRKKGKLVRERIAIEFTSEYSTETLEVHVDAVKPGARVIVHDDIMAVGECSRASAALMEQLGAQVVGVCFLAEITALGGRAKLDRYDVYSVVQL
jgi:adenine phosphoribosyltransferase